MTWSIIAHDAKAGHLGIAVSTCAFAVGARVPSIATGIGAVASQAFTNPFYGPKGIGLLRAGATAPDVVRILTEADEGRSQRQVHVMDNARRIAAYTGEGCVPWCGHLIGDGFSVAGNMLAGPAVIEETARVFEETAGQPLVLRFLAALKAGEAAGGDKRGKQSAAILIHDAEDYSLIDIRVDDHPDPLTELTRLEAVGHERYLHYRQFLPSRANPAGITDRAEIERRIAESIAAEKREHGA
ncbi:MAG: pilus assembly protein [Rhizobiales bacterium PAR1]|nr:MAG: pilus assembly protein [Rhizobiales bacterium PAR1]